jgi:hypothetical protein
MVMDEAVEVGHQCGGVLPALLASRRGQQVTDASVDTYATGDDGRVHRGPSPALEFVFDLTIVAAVAVAWWRRRWLSGRAACGGGHCGAWMNFTGSLAHDRDDVPYRLLNLAATGKPSQDGERRCVRHAGPTAPIP